MFGAVAFGPGATVAWVAERSQAARTNENDAVMAMIARCTLPGVYGLAGDNLNRMRMKLWLWFVDPSNW
jgi:hypothetical protein